jgi:hypothetical protein
MRPIHLRHLGEGVWFREFQARYIIHAPAIPECLWPAIATNISDLQSANRLGLTGFLFRCPEVGADFRWQADAARAWAWPIKLHEDYEHQAAFGLRAAVMEIRKPRVYRRALNEWPWLRELDPMFVHALPSGRLF